MGHHCSHGTTSTVQRDVRAQTPQTGHGAAGRRLLSWAAGNCLMEKLLRRALEVLGERFGLTEGPVWVADPACGYPR